MLHGVLRFTCRSTTVGHGARGPWAEVIKRLPSRKKLHSIIKHQRKKVMPPKRAKRRKVHVSRPAQAQAAEDEHQSTYPPPIQLPPLDEEEHVAAPDPTPQLEAESATEEAEEDTSGGRRRMAPRNATNLTMEEKELVIDFLQQNPTCSTLRGSLATKARRLKTDCGRSRP